jgi:hypothetical protein
VDSVSDETPDLGSTKDAVDRLLPRIVAELEDMVENGGQKDVRHKCLNCGNTQTVTIKVADADLYVKALSALSAASGRLKSDDDETSGAATKLLRDRSELTDAELAEYIVKLKADLAAEAESPGL